MFFYLKKYFSRRWCWIKPSDCNDSVCCSWLKLKLEFEMQMSKVHKFSILEIFELIKNFNTSNFVMLLIFSGYQNVEGRIVSTRTCYFRDISLWCQYPRQFWKWALKVTFLLLSFQVFFMVFLYVLESKTNEILKNSGALHYGDIVWKETKQSLDKTVV